MIFSRFPKPYRAPKPKRRPRLHPPRFLRIRQWLGQVCLLRFAVQECRVHKMRGDLIIGYRQDGMNKLWFKCFEWSQLGERHRRDDCDDHAYCEHHGSL